MADHLHPNHSQNRKSSSALGGRSPTASPIVRAVSPRPTATTDSPQIHPIENDQALFDIDLLAEEARAHEMVASLSDTQQRKLDLKGWRLIVIMLSIFMGLFLSFLDTSIVAVALATIASKFGAFENSSWVFTTYLLTYMAFGIILARLSDFFGLKTVEAFSFVLFLVFSALCGAARNMTQLIIFRAIQGIGGSGLYSMCTIISLAAVPADKIGDMATYVSLTQAVAVVLGPILGGVITQDQESDNWRWIFYLNLPFCFIAFVGLLVAWPKRTRGQDGRPYRMSFKSLEAIDFLGSALLLVACVMLIFSLQQAGAQVFAWDSGVVIESFVISGVAFVAFVIWEVVVERNTSWTLKPIFPLKVVGKRVMTCAIM
jgi:MFS family permease